MSHVRIITACLIAATLGIPSVPPLLADEIPPFGLTGDEFTSTTNIGATTESGYVRGTTIRLDGGNAAWVAHTSTGSGTRVGLWDASGSGEFTHATNGMQNSTISGLTESGIAYGISNRYYYNGVTAGGAGQAAWVADASAENISSHRVGFWDEADSVTKEFTYVHPTSNATQQYSTFSVNSSGTLISKPINGATYIAGYSRRYNGGTTQLGQTAWLANATTGETIRVGFTEGIFTKAKGTSAIGSQNSGIHMMNSSGYFGGYSLMYSLTDGTPTASQSGALWIGHVSDAAAITRIGLYDKTGVGEFTQKDTGVQSSINVITLTEAGYWAGHSNRYNNETGAGAGQGAWVADAATGETHRIGLWGEGYTSSTQYQSSVIKNDSGSGAAVALLNKGKVLGTSTRYSGTDNLGNAAWIADAATGVTRRLGLWDEGGVGTFTSASTGAQNSDVTLPLITTNSDYDYVWGYSQRYDETGAGADTNRTAWVYNFETDTQTAFDISVSTDGLSYSIVNGVTDGGVAFGSYKLYAGDIFVGDRAFFWGEAFGVHDLDGLVADQLITGGWETLTTITSATENGDLLTFIGQGVLAGGGTSQFSVTLDLASIAIPEPATWAGILGLPALVGAAALRRRR